ncbi:histidine--tRNA ligase [Orrella sp. 11846]|uniref:histidine--tRNA ligase n=1 Tax=Orrella sp. 11846 TaxID=3409913 RepID=UPI003B598197
MAEGFKKVSAVRGMNDLLPDLSYQWEALEEVLHRWLHLYGYKNMRIPILEHTRLFTRGIGEVTDIVEKEMYTFTDSLNGDSLTLRPEFTAGIVRSVIENNLLYDRPQRVYSIGPVFRHERPQRGRYRQFHQLDVEGLGFAGPDIDAEMILMTARLWKMLGLTDVSLELNSLGQLSERQAHRAALITHLEKHRDVLDEDGQRRLYSNPLRVLDTKNPAMQEMADAAPKLFDFLGDESRAHFETLCGHLDAAGIAYKLNPRMVRGLDYYNLTVFEWVTDKLGAQATICGGGRYDDLIGLLGGKPAPAIGFAIGLERLLDLWLQSQEVSAPAQCDVYVVHQGEAAGRFALQLGEELRDAGLNVLVHAGSGSFKVQMRRADFYQAPIAVILGDSEMTSQQAGVKVLRRDGQAVQGEQLDVAFDQLTNYLKDATAQTEE